MERNPNENDFLENNSPENIPFNSQDSIFSSNLFLDGDGEIILTQTSDKLHWKSIESVLNGQDPSSCFGIELVSKSESTLCFSDIYSAEFIDLGLVHEASFLNARGPLLGQSFEMYRFTIRGAQKSKTQPSVLVPSLYTFGHKGAQTCQMWVNRINDLLNVDAARPKNLMVFVHPKSGKGLGCKVWETVAPTFSQAKVKTKVTVTERAGQALDIMSSITNKELRSYDGVVAVGGDGFFNEILNGLLLSRHKSSYPPRPAELNHPIEKNGNGPVLDANVDIRDPSDSGEDESPLLKQSTNLRTGEDSCQTAAEDLEFSFPNEKFRFGIIPAGSTDAIVICTTGARDAITSALQIVLGKTVCLDVAQVVRWKKTCTSKDEPSVRYAASFAGYGFYGDVITESEKYRWMGPKRYDYAGTKVFLRHRSYEAEVAYVEVESEKKNIGLEKESSGNWTKGLWSLLKKSERVACRANCGICKTKAGHTSARCPSLEPYSKDSRWLKSRGRFLSVGAAVISCRNEKAPDGLVADAHLSDGFLHLILIKDCPHAFYLCHLLQLAKKDGNPLDFEFVEHHKTPAFTFTSFGKESIWNVDGELFQAHQLSAQVFRGLINLFASGPEA
ncbi:PREDICTED: ceramide kinase isoform X1 [Nicotiana attenuata]|uniref:Ceramide kinase n=1 Tax=Nicotiana attenuata TaxID=49451 RepID=A0A1J6JT41_NICAT|nr:PREDICTED: ceramide kinase isoform X1 [Nicotiana attenuata]OIT19668.1 ceramide kinase [Nicotiana attenuata]